ncbi:MAG: hypothetical protein ACNS62_24740 [Candidatus Cyclobacteriaceae bacterium M3_2C_046]
MKTSKVLITLLIAVIVGGSMMSCGSSDPNKAASKEMRSKAYSKARKEARQFKRQGWYVAPGALPMDKQIEKSWELQYKMDEDGYPLYIVSTGNSVAETQSAAKLQATELAKLELAGLVQTNVAALVENSIANNQLNNEEAASVTKTVAASKNVIAQEIGRVIFLFEIYRKIDKNVESSVRVGYNNELAKEAAKKAIRKQLEEQTDILHEKLDKLMDF